MSALATVAGRVLMPKQQKLISDREFYVAIVDADMGSLKSFHTLFDKYLDHMLVKFEQNRMARSVQIFVLFDKKW